MKKKFVYALLLSFSILALFGITSNVNVAEFNQSPPDDYSNFLDNLDESESIVVMPDGGILYGGEFEIYYSNMPDKPLVIDTETSPHAITVGDYKEHNPSSSIAEPFGADPANQTYVIPDRGYYASNSFTGSGWRFAGYNFRPADNTGAYLKWSTYGDSAMIGSVFEATYTKIYGSAYGRLINPNTAFYYTGYGNMTTYYTYNPKSGAYCIVMNF